MPVQKVRGGYRWGNSGKVYKTKAEAERQGRAIYAKGYKKSKKWNTHDESKCKVSVSW